MNLQNIEVSKKLVPEDYLILARKAQEAGLKKKAAQELKNELLTECKLPENGWIDAQIEDLINALSALDSNNFCQNVGVGGDVGRIACIARRNYNLAHGLGASNGLLETQPKAVGSSILNKLTNELLLDLNHTMGFRRCEECLMVPMNTDMAMTLCLMALKEGSPVDKQCSAVDKNIYHRSVKAAGLKCYPIPMQLMEDSASIDTEKLEENLKKHHASTLCIISKTSSLAPRNADDIVKIAKIAESYNVHHVIHNGSGLQSQSLMELINSATENGIVSLVVQNTDKNLMVPVGGTIIAGVQKEMMRKVSSLSSGQVSCSQSLDVFMTLLSLGKKGYLKLVEERQESFEYLHAKLKDFAAEKNLTISECDVNPISLAIFLDNAHENIVKTLGPMLFKRGAFGAVIVSADNKSNLLKRPYMTVSVDLGTNKKNIDAFLLIFKECWDELEQMYQIGEWMSNLHSK